MFDTHCHVDLYPDPMGVAQECESLGIHTIAVTSLPSHFKLAQTNLAGFKKLRPALGMHPLYADRHNAEFILFEKYFNDTSYIGEVGLDFSKEGIETKALQLDSFERVLKMAEGKGKLLSIHSRKAEAQVLELLRRYNIRSAIFHWYSGPLDLIREIQDAGYFFSVNPAMTRSRSGQETIKMMAPAQVLTESDGPFVDCKGRPCRPSDLALVTAHLASAWGMPKDEVQQKLNINLNNIIAGMQKSS
jgi:TatD DNase family protein